MNKDVLIKKQKGITLISLVVTIIILIILGGVSINLLLGNSGIISKAKEAEKQYKIANLKEQISFYILDLQMQNEKIIPKDVFDKMKEKGYTGEDAKLEGIWISTFDTKISTINPNIEAIMIDGENSGYTYGPVGEKYQYMGITAYSGNVEKDFVVPDYIDGKLVTTIKGSIINGDNLNLIESLKLPDSVTTIDGYAFWNNSVLKTIHLPYLLETIDNGSFGKCTSLTEIVIPDNVITIGMNAFVNCSNVSKVVLNEKIQTIGDYAFADLKNSTTSITIPSTITEIGKSAFNNFGINNDNIIIYVPNIEITIGDYAFANCKVKKYDVNLTQSNVSTIDIDKVKNIYNLTGKYVFLTFDDGPSYDKMTDNILDILKENNIKATFFMIGSMVEQYPDAVKRAYEEGHYIANHGYSTDNAVTYASKDKVLEEYNQTEESIREAIGNSTYNSKLFRFPGGSTGNYSDVKEKAKELLEANEIAYIDWNADINDAAKKEDGTSYTVEEMYQRMIQTTENKNIIVLLMHNYGTKTNSDQVLEQSITYLKNEGYEFKNFYDLNSLV